MQLYDRLKKALHGNGGEALVVEIEREVADKHKAVADRKRLDAEIREWERKKREELPALREKTAAAEAEVARVRKELQKAQRAQMDARTAESDLYFSIGQGIDRARIHLARAAWPWLHETIERAKDRRREWHDQKWKQYRWWRREKVSVEPHSSDPEYRRMKVHGARYRMTRYGSNDAACERVRESMDQALDALERLLWRVEEPTRDEVAALMTAFDERTWAETAHDVVWIEPQAPRYDANGVQIVAA